MKRGMTMTNGEGIAIRGLSKNYGKTMALEMIDLTLPKGKIIGLLGPNGSGKTTLLKILSGLLMNYDGRVTINGHSPDLHTKRIVSYLPDSPYFADWMKIKDATRLFKDMYPDFRTDLMAALLSRFELSPKMRIKTMSKGMKEKFQLALVMSRKAEIYLLDEPIGGVDPAARDVILQTILANFNPESLLLISTHLIQDVEKILDEVIFIKNGRIVLHEPRNSVIEREGKSIDDVFREVFKC